MTDQQQIDALKAQVNCLREVLKVLDRNSKAREALETTPEQCLAEVKAKAIEDAVKTTSEGYDGIAPFDLTFYAKQLRKQAK